MSKLIILMQFAILLLGACADVGTEVNTAQLNVVPALSTADSTTTELQGTNTPDQRSPISTPSKLDIGRIEKSNLDMPVQITPSSAYPDQVDLPSAMEAYPASPEDVEIPTPYPAPFAGIETSPMSGYRVVNTYFHDPGAYTQGLVITGNGSEFIEGTGLWGQSSLRRVDIETGQVKQYLALAEGYFGEGLTVINDRIIQLTWKSNTGFIYDNESFETLGTFSYPHEGWGITNDGQQLIVSDGTDIIRFWDPESFAETKRIQVSDEYGPVFLLNELEYVEGEILANVWYSDMIARISPETGDVIGWIDLAGLVEIGEDAAASNVLNGIAYDDQTGQLFVTGKRWPVMFEIELVPK